MDGFSSSGVQNFADWKLLEQVLLFSEKSVSEKILKSLCDEVLRSFNTGDFVRAKDIYSQVSAYEDNAVTEMRKSVCDLAKGIIGKNDDTAKYFIDGYLLYEQDEDKFLSQIRNIVGNSIEKSDFNFAKKYCEDWLKYENYDLSANYSALKIKYKVKTLKVLENNKYNCVSFAKKNVEIGDKIFAIGNSLGDGLNLLDGMVGDVNRKFKATTTFLFNALVTHGCSGGPVFNDKGEVCGVTVGGANIAAGMNFALPLSTVLAFIERAKKDKELSI